MKIMMSAGEASGDLHGGALAAELKKLRPDIELFGMGGSDMQKSGVRIIYDINNLGIIGVVEVVKHIPFFFRLRDTLKQAMIDEKPDALVCIDYPGFNMRLAHVAKELGILSFTILLRQSGLGTREGRRKSSAMWQLSHPFSRSKPKHTRKPARMSLSSDIRWLIQ